MTTCDFHYVCEGRRLFAFICDRIVNLGTFAFEDERKVWRIARVNGWREAKWKGKTRHLCPACWQLFIERRK